MDVIHRADLVFLRSVHTPAYPEPEWKHAPDMSAVAGVPERYWKAPPDWEAAGAGPLEMSQPEKDAADAARDVQRRDENRAVATAAADDDREPVAWELRAVIATLNKRINWATKRLMELQEDLQAVRASNGPADNIRAAIRNNYSATATRYRAEAIAAYKADLAAGEGDP